MWIESKTKARTRINYGSHLDAYYPLICKFLSWNTCTHHLLLAISNSFRWIDPLINHGTNLGPSRNMLARNFRHKRFPPSSYRFQEPPFIPFLLAQIPARASVCTIINSNDYGKHKWKKTVSGGRDSAYLQVRRQAVTASQNHRLERCLQYSCRELG